MTTLGIIQIIYLSINIIGLIASFIVSLFNGGFDCFLTLLDVIKRRLGVVTLIIFNILFITLFLPMISIIGAFIIFLVFLYPPID